MCPDDGARNVTATLPASPLPSELHMHRTSPAGRPGPREVRAPWADRAFAIAAHGAAWLTLALLVGIIISLVIGAAPAIEKAQAEFLDRRGGTLRCS